MTTPETSVRYAERFRLLSRMAAREVMQDADSPISLAALVQWLSDRRAMLRNASWRQYRCAIDHHCKTVLDLDEETRKDLLKSLYGKSDPETIAARMQGLAAGDVVACPQTTSRFGLGQIARLPEAGPCRKLGL